MRDRAIIILGSWRTGVFETVSVINGSIVSPWKEKNRVHSIVIGNEAKRTRRWPQLGPRLFISGCIPASINSIFYTRTNIVPAIEPGSRRGAGRVGR